jgi:hypothetical protein
MLKPPRLSGVGAAALIYLLALLVFFWRVIFLPDYGIPWDIVDSHFTAQSFFSQWVRRGVFPLWNPHVTMGYPIAGDMALSPFYPPTVLSWLVPVGGPFHFKVLEIVLILHVLLAGVGAFLLCRYLRLDFLPALFGGLVFMFGGFFPVRMSHEGWVKTAAWTPLVLLLFMRAVETRSRRALLGCAGAFAMMILAGFWQHCLYTAYLLGAWLLWTTLPRIPKTGFRPLLDGTARLALVIAAAAGFAAIQVLPAVELAAHAARSKLTFEDSAQGAIHVLSLATVILPDLYRPAANQDISGNFSDPSMIHLYTGMFVLAFAWVGARTCTAPHRHRGFFIALGLISLALTLGAASPVYRIAFDVLPGFAMFRRPWAFYLFVVLSLAVLGAIGLQAALAADHRDRRILRQAGGGAIGLFVVCVLGWAVFEWLRQAETGIRASAPIGQDALLAIAPWLAHAFGVMVLPALAVFVSVYAAPRLRAPAGVLVCLLAFADLYWFNANRKFNIAPMRVAELVTPTSILGKVMPGEGALGRDGSGWYRVALANFGGVFENAGDIMGFENFGGYNPFRLRTYTEFAGLIDGPGSPLLDLANVKYVLSASLFQNNERGAQEPSAASPMNYRIFLRSGTLDPARYAHVATTGSWYELYENRTVLPRYFGVSDVIVKPDLREQLGILRAGFDFRRRVLLDRRVGDPGAGCDALTFRMDGYSPATTKLTVSAPGRCILLGSEIWYPGWRAFVDGREVPVMRADYALRAIEVPGGTHAVEFRFRPWTVSAGAAITAMSALLAIALLLVKQRRQRAV